MKKQTVTEFVIFSIFPVGRRKMYITAISTRPDNKILPMHYSEEKDSAKTWGSVAAVENAIGRIHNTHDRDFDYEEKESVITKKENGKILNGKVESISEIN